MDTKPLNTPPSLDQLRGEGVLALFLDFDGTLVDLAATPDGIQIPEQLSDRLGRLRDTLGGRLALVSGRAVTDLERHLGPLTIARAGSHGAARMRADGSRIGEDAQALPPAVNAELAHFAQSAGFDLESKDHGAALHYRRDPSLEQRGLDFVHDLADRHELAVKRGKFVIELVHRGADKAGAVRAFMAEPPFAGATPVFIGDDVTDEDGFAAAEALGGFGIVVGDRTPTRARYRLDSPQAVHDWLAL
ncbi:trehalose-phosphatase [Altericroceibacterium xinjiangense]|uniref:trehalose-phosphatase n=1 Tax=Altericroceibacterium xinjiangense TaxID=762261 RepID=UPI000F7E3662|nr:trehalose-phosphatase [Altericroceibacterium xinjiangense]